MRRAGHMLICLSHGLRPPFQQYLSMLKIFARIVSLRIARHTRLTLYFTHYSAGLVFIVNNALENDTRDR